MWSMTDNTYPEGVPSRCLGTHNVVIRKQIGKEVRAYMWHIHHMSVEPV